jgi:phosphoribosylglycinamide formyltransferase-1
MSEARLAVLISGQGRNLQALIDAGLPIAGVLSNQPEAYGLERAQAAGIATAVVQHRDFPTREAFDAQMQQVLAGWGITHVALAGFMRILTAEFVQSWQGKMLNIHPSLLPKHKGLHTHQAVLAAGDTHHGATVHFVSPALDSGAIVVQAALTVRADDTPDTLAARVMQLETEMYPVAWRWLLSGVLR